MSEQKFYIIVPFATSALGGKVSFAYTKTEAKKIARRYVAFGHSALVHEADANGVEFLTKEDRRIRRKIDKMTKRLQTEA